MGAMFHYPLKCSCPPSSSNCSPLANSCSLLLAQLGLLVIYSPFPLPDSWLDRDYSGSRDMGQAGSKSFPKNQSDDMGEEKYKHSPSAPQKTGVRRGIEHLGTIFSSHTEEAVSAGWLKKANRQREEGHEWRETRQGLENDTTGQEKHRPGKAQRKSWSHETTVLALVTPSLPFSFHSIRPSHSGTINSHLS